MGGERSSLRRLAEPCPATTGVPFVVPKSSAIRSSPFPSSPGTTTTARQRRSADRRESRRDLSRAMMPIDERKTATWRREPCQATRATTPIASASRASRRGEECHVHRGRTRSTEGGSSIHPAEFPCERREPPEPAGPAALAPLRERNRRVTELYTHLWPGHLERARHAVNMIARCSSLRIADPRRGRLDAGGTNGPQVSETIQRATSSVG